MKGILYVQRDDKEYDYKSGFKSYNEANNYRCTCQRRWLGHCDYVMFKTEEGFRYNLTSMNSDERLEFMKKYGIPIE